MASDSSLPRIVITAGEPAGIGPDIIIDCLQQRFDASLLVIGDPATLATRADQLDTPLTITEQAPDSALSKHQPGMATVVPVACKSPTVAGQTNPENAGQVVQCINLATDLCLSRQADAMVTAPVHKAVINQGGIAFSGHTEWIAERCGGATPVMMLANDQLRVCLATTHLPLSAVPAAITSAGLRTVIEIMTRDISRLYQIDEPVIGVCGLNPHAGEGGYLGKEEIDTIEPLVAVMNAEGHRLVGPLPADTAFTPSQLARFDAVLAMYHDQGLPVIKHQGFGEVVNVTLGLPIIRTSVDHGTALDLAATGKASADSMATSIRLAIRFANNRAIG